MPHTGPILEGRGDTDYERYVRVPELLELQKPIDKLAHPEERLFQVTHQTAELWLHHIDYEIDRVAGHLDADEAQLAADLLHRCRLIIDLLREQIIILETMAPADYHVLRIASLGRGSGQESPGFRILLDVRKRLWPRFEALLAKRGLAILDVERAPREHYDVFRLVQSMMDYDESFLKWRYTHMRLAFRIIGDRVLSLKGVPAAQLEAGPREPLFPELWAAISELTAEHKPSY
ncbi:MAG TPA: tryptophan 2,3-dioxygenase family protein [Thermoanaerobaculia bacterium]|nr:tryptophan 2,3-dioxygenase family protein [Thermoanaerobaculia bacterium]